MIIDISNEKKINRFYKMIPLYKSFFFNFTKFEINTKNKEIEPIIKALNIKRRKQRITFIYDEACKIIDENDKNKNICGFKNNKCYTQQCIKKEYYNGCCRKCLYQSPNGCKTKNLSCKLFVCSEVEKRHKVIKYKDLKILKVLSLKNRYIIKSNYFSKREDFLKDLYTYTLTYATIRIIYRLVINSIKRRNI